MGVMHLSAFTAAVAAAVALLPAAHGHGWQMIPPSRHLEECNGAEVAELYNINGGLGGGASMDTYDRGGYPPPCGDPFNAAERENQGKSISDFINMPCQQGPEVYEEGGVMDITWKLWFNHGGFFGCSVCDDLNDMSEECFARNELLTVSHGTNRSYILEGYGDTKQPRWDYTMQWQLPEGLTCEHCAVSCTWWTAHGCMYPCDPEVCDFYADRQNPFKRYEGSELYGEPVDKDCASLWAEPGELPQIWRNCGDISIQPKGGAAAPAQPPSASEPAPAPAVDPVDMFATPPEDAMEDAVKDQPAPVAYQPATVQEGPGPNACSGLCAWMKWYTNSDA